MSYEYTIVLLIFLVVALSYGVIGLYYAIRHPRKFPKPPRRSSGQDYRRD